MGGTRRSEDFAGETVLELHGLAVNCDLFRPRRRSVSRGAGAIGDVCWGDKNKPYVAVGRCSCSASGQMEAQLLGGNFRKCL